MPQPLEDPSLLAMGRALDHLSRYQQVIGTNLANIDTPGYRAQTVEFEAALSSALAREVAPPPLARTNASHLAAPGAEEGAGRVVERRGVAARLDGNTVDVNVEMLALVETGLKYRTLSQLTGKRLALYRAIAIEA